MKTNSSLANWEIIAPCRHSCPPVALVLICFALFVLTLAGCTTKSSAKAQARAAYSAGQQQALERVLQSRNSVTVVGTVRNPLVPWTEDLTLAKALVAADYYARGNPREIIIVRNGQPLPVDPKRLLSGEDFALEAGDVVNIR